LKRLPNDELLQLYDSELVLRIRNIRNLSQERRLLAKFKQHLNGYAPSPELAKSFLSQYADRRPNTLCRYAQTIRSFMKWYGEPIDDFKVRAPKMLPPYTEDSDIDKLIGAIENKKTHKGCIVRDLLLVELALFAPVLLSSFSMMGVALCIASAAQVSSGRNNPPLLKPSPTSLIASVNTSRALTGSIFSSTAFLAQLAAPLESYSNTVLLRFSRISLCIFRSPS